MNELEVRVLSKYFGFLFLEARESLKLSRRQARELFIRDKSEHEFILYFSLLRRGSLCLEPPAYQ